MRYAIFSTTRGLISNSSASSQDFRLNSEQVENPEIHDGNSNDASEIVSSVIGNEAQDELAESNDMKASPIEIVGGDVVGGLKRKLDYWAATDSLESDETKQIKNEEYLE